MPFIQTIDDSILMFIQNNMRNTILDKLMVFFSSLGNSGFIWFIIAIIFLITKKYRKYGVILLVSAVIAYVGGEVLLKSAVKRIRPCNVNLAIQMLVERPQTYSCPSLHSLSGFMASYIILKANKKFGIAAFILTFIISFSRMYLYVHYPSDVLSGAILGTIIAIITYKLMNEKFDRNINENINV